MSATPNTEPFTVTLAREDVARTERRLRRAERDLVKALGRQERVDQYEPGIVTSRYEIQRWQIEAADRVRDLTVRVKVRREFAADAHERLARNLREAAAR